MMNRGLNKININNDDIAHAFERACWGWVFFRLEKIKMSIASQSTPSHTGLYKINYYVSTVLL